MVGWLVGRLVDQSGIWLVGRLVVWLVLWLVGWLVGLLVGRLEGCWLVACYLNVLICMLANWFVACLRVAVGSSVLR